METETLFVIALLAILVLYFALQRKSKPRRSGGRASVSKEQRILDENLPWLRERWQAAQEIDDGDTSIFPKWYFDDATDAQLRRIEETGLTISGGTPTRGQTSDIIGLFEPAEDEQLEVLKYFKISRTGMSQTRARQEVARLMLDPANKKSWEGRPATQLQREFYRFVGLKVPKGLTYLQAERDSISPDESIDDEKLDEWNAFSGTWDSLCDAETREEFEVKKPSMAVFKQAWDALRSDGVPIDEIELDLNLIVSKLIEIKPDLSRT